MSTRLDATLQKYPSHEESIRLLASRDPSGNLKYLDWGAKMVAAQQALAPEVADIIEMFHRFRGQPIPGKNRGRTFRQSNVAHDVYAYSPKDLASLRDNLLKLQRAQDKKRRKREKLYRLDGATEADVVYDSPDLIVRHIKNKQASCHYGLGTKWCISMLREPYFEQYETSNATFFFFERKKPLGDEYDKMALMVPRNGDGDDVNRESITAFTSTDRPVDMMSLAKVHGTRVFDIFREVYERSERYPGSAMYQVYAGKGSPEQLAEVFAIVRKGKIRQYEVEATLEAICCNDAAPESLLLEVARRARTLVRGALKKQLMYGRRRRRRRPWSESRAKKTSDEMARTVAAAIVIHPQVSEAVRERFIRQLRRSRITIANITRRSNGRVGVSFGKNKTRRYRYRRDFRHPTLAMLRRMLARSEKNVVRCQKKIEKAEAAKALADAKKQQKAQRV